MHLVIGRRTKEHILRYFVFGLCLVSILSILYTCSCAPKVAPAKHGKPNVDPVFLKHLVKLSNDRIAFERMDLQQNGGVLLSDLACGPFVLFPLGKSDEILNLIIGSGGKDEGSWLLLSKLDKGKPRRLFKVKLVAKHKDDTTAKGTLNRYLASKDLRLDRKTPQLAVDYVERNTTGFACYRSIYPIGSLECLIIFPDGHTSTVEEREAEELQNGGYPICQDEIRLLK